MIPTALTRLYTHIVPNHGDGRLHQWVMVMLRNGSVYSTPDRGSTEHNSAIATMNSVTGGNGETRLNNFSCADVIPASQRGFDIL